MNAKMAAAGELAEFQRKAHEGEIRLLHQSLADCEAAHEARCADLVARMATATAEISVLKSEIESLSTLNRQAESRVSEVTTSKGKIEKLLQQALVRESRSAAHVAVLVCENCMHANRFRMISSQRPRRPPRRPGRKWL